MKQSGGSENQIPSEGIGNAYSNEARLLHPGNGYQNSPTYNTGCHCESGRNIWMPRCEVNPDEAIWRF
jgi:hypothetical protein